MRITRKNGTNRRGRTERTGGTRCPFDRSVHSLFARPSSLWERRKGRKRKREGKRQRGVGLRANITYIPRHVRSVHVALFWTPVAYPEAGLKRCSVVKNINCVSFPTCSFDTREIQVRAPNFARGAYVHSRFTLYLRRMNGRFSLNSQWLKWKAIDWAMYRVAEDMQVKMSSDNSAARSSKYFY